MKLLIVDECMAPGGVETLRLNLVPELAKFCESVVWALPLPYGELLRERILERNVPNLTIENLSWPRGSVQQIGVAMFRRLPRIYPLGKAANWVVRKSVDLRIRKLAKKHGSICCLTTYVFNQPPPDSGLPLAGFVCDINPILPESTRRNIVQWVPAAQAIFGISEFTCGNLRLLAANFAEKIHAIPIAAPPLLGTPTLRPSCQNDFYFPAAANEHKNHLVLFQACVELIRRGVTFKLVLSGPGIENFATDRPFKESAMEEARRFFKEHSKELNGSVTIAGNVTPTEVNDLYDSSRCVLLPSRYEGFGLPLVEALQRGKQILCSDIPAFREQLSLYDAWDRARLVPSGEAAHLADAMERFLNETSLPQDDLAALKLRMARWTWADVARRCYNLLCSISP